MARVKVGWVAFILFVAAAVCWIGYGAFFYHPTYHPTRPSKRVAANVPAPEPAGALQAVAPVIVEDSAAEADQEEAATGPDFWVAPSEESTPAEVVGWQRVSPGTWLIPETAAHEVSAEVQVADAGTSAEGATRRGDSSDARRAGLEAEIRVEYRSLERARETYRGATPLSVGQTRMPFRRIFGVRGGGGDPYGDIEFYLADGAWATASQQHNIVQSLLDAYAQAYGGSGLSRFVRDEGIDMTPLHPRHLLREQRREFIGGVFQAVREDLARLGVTHPYAGADTRAEGLK